MIEMDTLAGKIFSLLKGNNLQVKIYDDAGSETTDPNMGRRFFVASPNIMITIDEDSNCIEVSKGADVGNDVVSLQKSIKKLANEFLMNSSMKVFGKQIQPRDYAYQAKIKKAAAPMMEQGNDAMEETVMESFSKMFGSLKTSQQTLENVRIFPWLIFLLVLLRRA